MKYTSWTPQKKVHVVIPDEVGERVVEAHHVDIIVHDTVPKLKNL